jgi:hypothetical protein
VVIEETDMRGEEIGQSEKEAEKLKQEMLTLLSRMQSILDNTKVSPLAKLLLLEKLALAAGEKLVYYRKLNATMKLSTYFLPREEPT